MSNKIEYYIALDVGTTGCKAILINNLGYIVSKNYIESPIINLRKDWVEQDAKSWWTYTVENIRKVVAVLDKTEVKDIKSISVCSQGISVVPVDIKGKILRAAICWLDNRAKEETQELMDIFGEDYIFKLTGKRIASSYTLPKILWLKRYEPIIYDKVYKFLLPVDYIIYKFTGRFATDNTMASGTLAFDINNNSWSNSLLDKLGIKRELFPEILHAGEIVSDIKGEVADLLGLPSSIRIIMGGQDQKCGALGSGIDFDSFSISLGTASAICSLTKGLVFDKQMRIPISPFLIKDVGLLEGVVSTAGASLRWYRDTIGYEEIMEARKNNIDFYLYLDRMVKKNLDRQCNIFFYPHLSGSSTPDWNSNSRGAFIGLTLSTRKEDLVRSIYEGIAYQIKKNIDLIEDISGLKNNINVYGGMAKSSVFCQILSDILNKNVHTLGDIDAALIGAGIIASYQGRSVANYKDKVNKFIKTKQKFVPCKRNHSYYKDKYREYTKIEKKLLT